MRLGFVTKGTHTICEVLDPALDEALVSIPSHVWSDLFTNGDINASECRIKRYGKQALRA